MLAAVGYLMKLSERMLTVAVLLVGALMAVSEAPEILTLTDNVSNDCVWVQTAQGSARHCVVKDPTRHPPSGRSVYGPPGEGRDGLTQDSLHVTSSKSPRTLLSLLVSQRK